MHYYYIRGTLIAFGVYLGKIEVIILSSSLSQVWPCHYISQEKNVNNLRKLRLSIHLLITHCVAFIFSWPNKKTTNRLGCH